MSSMNKTTFISKFPFMQQKIWWLGLLVAFIVRVVGLGSLPISLYWEEVALGYDAYSLWQTGADHHGNFLPIVALESFGDWKPPVYAYLASPLVGIFGLTSWAVRLPAALAGVWLVVVISYLGWWWAKYLNLSNEVANRWAVWSIWLASLSVWGVIFSRGAWEVMVASSLLTTAMALLLAFSENKQVKYLWLAAVSMGISLYTYHAARLLVPIFLFFFIVFLFQNSAWRSKAVIEVWLRKNITALLIVLFTSLLLALPLLADIANPSVTTRFAQTSLLSVSEGVEQTNYWRSLVGNNVISRLVFHRYWYWAGEIIANLGKHLTIDFLFVSGDKNPRHSLQLLGQLYPLDLILFLTGLVWLTKDKLQKNWFWLAWFILALLPASLTTATPHALRSLMAWPAAIILLTTGADYIYLLLIKLKTSDIFLFKPKLNLGLFVNIIIFIVVCLYLLQAVVGGLIWWRYHKVANAHEYQYGYKEVVQHVLLLQKQYSHLPTFFSREQGRPLMYYWFFSKADPKQVQAVATHVLKDQSELLEFNNIYIVPPADISNTTAIVVLSENEQENLELQNEYIIKYPNGKTAWRVGIKE